MDYVVKNKSLRDFPAWSGAVSTLQLLIEGNFVDEIDEFITVVFGDKIPTMMEVNDFLWFDTYTIAEHLGFDSFDELVDFVKKWK